MEKDANIAAMLERESRILQLFGDDVDGIMQDVRDEMLRSNRTNRAFSVIQVTFDAQAKAPSSAQDGMRRKLIATLQSRFREKFRPTDRSGVCGPTKFLCVLPETDVSGAWIAAEKLVLGQFSNLASRATKTFCEFKVSCADFNPAQAECEMFFDTLSASARVITRAGLETAAPV
ncbi:MAG: hypothetical protein MRY74_02245 [Neomegalonema sp.]|nr:hypothetical protein [Neomegalonema sp.]